MKIFSKRTGTGRVSVELPVFTAESGKENRRAGRMNGFFALMGSEMEKYAAGADLLSYRASFLTEGDPSAVLTVRVTARGRFRSEGGVVSAKREIVTVWERGLLKSFS